LRKLIESYQLRISIYSVLIMAPASGLLNSFLAAIQASLSVLLVILYGGLTAHFKLLESPVASKISKLCVKVFLPALLFVQIGSELHIESANRYVIVLVWAFVCHLVSFLIGILAHFGFGMPDWITAAIMFNNTTSYPLLLIQSLQETGILQSLVGKDETLAAAIGRAKSYFLVFATISSCLTFSIGPRLIDTEHAPEESKEDEHDEEDEEQADEANGTDETTGLLSAANLNDQYRRASVAFLFSGARNSASYQPKTYDRRPSVVPKKKWIELHPRTKWWLLFIWDFFNAPLLGAVAGAIVGLVPALHRAFFYDTSNGGIFTAWLTASFKTIGQLFVPLPVVIAGVSLYTSIRASRDPEHAGEPGTPWLTTAFILVVRFLIWPVASIAVIYGLAKRTGVVGDDPMLWFALMLMPTGAPAMKLITMVQVSGADQKEEHKIAWLLTVRFPESLGLAVWILMVPRFLTPSRQSLPSPWWEHCVQAWLLSEDWCSGRHRGSEQINLTARYM
jgi:predicted permease